MSNKTRLQTNNTNLQELINKANSLPDAGGSGGGGSVETCSLTINDSMMRVAMVIYQPTLGETVYITADPMTPASGTYEIVRGSLFYIDTQGAVSITCNGCKEVYRGVYIATAGTGESITVNIS